MTEILIALGLSIISVEAFIQLPFRNIIYEIFNGFNQSFDVLKSKTLSDEEKQKMLLSNSKIQFRCSFLLIIFLVVIISFIASFLIILQILFMIDLLFVFDWHFPMIVTSMSISYAIIRRYFV